MTALDVCEPQIIRALEKDGWQVVEKPFFIPTDDHVLLADFTLQQMTPEEVRTILVMEVKCFTHSRNDLQELYTAVGQYLVYRTALKLNRIDRPLYLALPDAAYRRLMDDRLVATVFQDIEMRLVIVKLETEEVIQWIN